MTSLQLANCLLGDLGSAVSSHSRLWGGAQAEIGLAHFNLKM